MNTNSALREESFKERNISSYRRELTRRFADHVRMRDHVPARDLTTIGVGGAVQLIVEPTDLDVLTELIEYFSEHNLSWRVLGAGSNVLVSERGVSDIVIRLGSEFGGFAFVEPDEVGLSETWRRSHLPTAPTQKEGNVSLFAFAGASLMGLSRRAAQWGLERLEFAAGIPASVGGAVKMNAGAHGSCIGDVVQSVVVLDRHARLQTLSREDLAFEYRKSVLPDGAFIIGARFNLSIGDPMAISRRRNSCLEYRKRTQPLQFPSAGSTFRNPSVDSQGMPTEYSAARLIEECGLKGLTQGGMGFSNLHANWLVRLSENASAADAELLIRLAQEEVKGRFQIELHPEVILW